MFNKRKNIRYQTLARVHLPGLFEGEAMLKDLSVTGCGIESTEFVDIKMDKKYKIQIIPEAAAKIDSFELIVEPRWIRTGEYSCEIGFYVVKSPKGKLFQRYVDYLDWRASAQ
ncbi:PilZ domain-containing protein [Breznakiella homolactica]|uniref:PilZ domain-containing protein n=1 Tax=Breznakiella homolactica TaxID=2798577 RepID=A0A7T7XP37_9SPIR|nr:PilZ domain-containing protein [Breznakiella homolactica]QQO09895.1 PilZ domain-containing protein [Breznakiella homolactica]